MRNANLFGGILAAGLFVFNLQSANAQDFWERTNGPYGGSGDMALAVHPNGELYCGTEGGVFRSTDNGNNWMPTALTNVLVYALMALPNGDIEAASYSFLTRTGKAHRSTDGGASWNEVGLGDAWVRDLAYHPNGYLFAGTSGSGVFRSTDGGDSWMAANNGLTNHQIEALSVYPDGTIFAGTGGAGFFAPATAGLPGSFPVCRAPI